MWGRWTTLEMVVGTSTFVLVIALWTMGLVAWRMQRVRAERPLRRRLGAGPVEGGPRELRLWRDGREIVTQVPGQPARLSIRQRLDQLHEAAGLEVPAESLLLWGLGLAALLALLALALSQSIFAAVAVVVLFLLAVQWYLDRRVLKRTALFDRQLVSGLDLAARSLRAGHPLLSAFRLIADEVPAPVGVVFARVCQQQAMGMSLEEALRRVAQETGSNDMKVFATSVVIQMRSGANLADMMDRLTDVIRERLRLTAHIRVLTAQTRFSKRLLLLVPIILFLVISALNPEYMEPLYSTTSGKIMLAVAGTGMIFGGWLMGRMARLRY